MNKRADVPETMEWILASIIILAIMVTYIILVLVLFVSPTRGWSVQFRKESSTQNTYLHTKIAINYLNSEFNGEKIKNIIQEKGTNSKTEIEEYTKNYFQDNDFIWEVIIEKNNKKERISNEKLDETLYGSTICPTTTEVINMPLQNSNKEKINLKMFICQEKKEPDLQMEGGGP